MELAEERDSPAIVVRSRSLSGVKSALLHAVRRAVAAIDDEGRPVLVVPPAD